MRDRAKVSIIHKYVVVDCLSESAVIFNLWRLLAVDKILLAEDFMHIKQQILLLKTWQFIYLVKGTRVTRVKQQIFFLDVILEHTLIDGIKEAPLQGNFPYIGELA